MFKKDNERKFQRLWQDGWNLTHLIGYDLERSLWDTVMGANCDATFLAECARLREWYAAVFL